MSLITLSGTMSASDIEANFEDKRAALNTVNAINGKPFQYDHRVNDLTNNAAMVPLATKDFTVPDDMLFVTMGMAMYNPDATSRTITLTLSAITNASTAVAVPSYLMNQSIFVTATGGSASTFNATRYVPATTIYLIKGITYRMLFTSSSATAVDSAFGFVLARQFKRYR